jgi:hypothetical protein
MQTRKTVKKTGCLWMCLGIGAEQHTFCPTPICRNASVFRRIARSTSYIHDSSFDSAYEEDGE